MDIGNDDLWHASDRTSSSASSTNYDKIFKNGPPKSNIPVNSRRFSGYIKLYEYTMELIEQQTLCFAIWSNKEQQLKAAFDKAFEANGLQRKYETETRKDYETGKYTSDKCPGSTRRKIYPPSSVEQTTPTEQYHGL